MTREKNQENKQKLNTQTTYKTVKNTPPPPPKKKTHTKTKNLIPQFLNLL